MQHPIPVLIYIFFAVNVSLCYKGVELFKCHNKLLSECLHMAPDKEHYLIEPEIAILNKTLFINKTELLDVIGTPGRLNEINPGSFNNLPKLKRIWLGGNMIKIIPYGVFNELPVYYIYLAANNIQTIDTEAFNDMENLTEIYLDKNSLTYFDSDWFKIKGKLSGLRILNLHHNKIRALSKKSFHNLPNLRELDLSFNEIDYVSDDLFNTPNPNLKIIDLSFNYIKTLSPNILNNVAYVERFILSFNYIRNLDPEMLDKTYIKSASIHPNQWICPCLAIFEKKLYDTGIKSVSSSETFKTHEYFLKYQLPGNTHYLGANLSICYETWKACNSLLLNEDFQLDKPFETILRKTYNAINVKCNHDTDCSEGMLCRSNYCWYLITKAFFNVNDPYFFVWDTYVSLG